MCSEDLSVSQKTLLKTILCKTIVKSCSSSSVIADGLSVSKGYVNKFCNTLMERGMLTKNGKDWVLTDLGRKQIVVVLTGGVFDIIHPGHLFTLSSAKKLGDVLIVSVARDVTVKHLKGHYPLNREEQRVELVGSLRFVDLSMLGSQTDMFELVEYIKPDVIALGYDQAHNAEDLSNTAKRRGIQLKIVRFDTPVRGIKSSSIINNSDSVEEF